jgi:hypothetical protein
LKNADVAGDIETSHGAARDTGNRVVFKAFSCGSPDDASSGPPLAREQNPEVASNMGVGTARAIS